MLRLRVAVVGIVATGLLSVAAIAAESQGLASLKRLNKPGNVKATVGDLLVVSQESNASLGPANPASNLQVKVEGDAVKKLAVVLIPPPKKDGKMVVGAPSKLDAYFIAEKAGEATITVVPVKPDGKTGEARTFTVKVAEAQK